MSTATETVAGAASDTMPLAEFLPLLERTDVEQAALLRANPGPVTYAPAPFYAAAGVVRAEARLPAHPVVMRFVYAPGERRLLPLGTPERVRAANAAAGLRLSAAAAVPYLNFYLEAAGGARPARVIVQRSEDVRWMPDAGLDADERAARAQAAARIHAAEVRPRPAGGFAVTATAVRGYALEAVTYGVGLDGSVTEERVTSIMDGLPIAAAF